jgi:hypothetical protein
MNELLPTSRDLPPAGHAKIRAELQRVAERNESRSRRFAPILTGVAALAVLGLIVWLAPWKDTAVTTPVATQPPPARTTATVAPPIAGMSTTDTDKIAHGCQGIAHVPGTPRVYNMINDEAGKFALVYTETNVLTCTIDFPGMPYNSGYAGVQQHDWLPGDMSVDSIGASSGENGSGKYPPMKGQLMAAGRITSKVAKVTYTADGTTVTAQLANGTFVARIVRPTTWKITDRMPMGIVRAYDANGTLITAQGDPQFPTAKCYSVPDSKDIIYADRDPDLTKCAPATRWQ